MAAPTDPAAAPTDPAGPPTDPAAAPTGAALPAHQALPVVCGLLAATFVAVLSSTTVPVALPALVRDLGGSTSWYGWVVAVELAAAGAALPVWSRLSASRRPALLLQGALVLLVGGSLVAGAAAGPAALLAGRIGQGLGAGGVAVLVPAVLAAVLPPTGPARFSGVFGVAFALATVGGPVLGGVLVDAAAPGWRWSLLAGVPLGLVAVVLLQRAVRHRPAGAGSPPGAVLRLLPALPVAAAAVALAGVGAVATAGTVLLAVHLQDTLGHPSATAGLLLLPLVVGVVAASTVSGAVVTARGGRRAVLVAGAVTVVAATAGLATVTGRTPTALVVVGGGALGAGLGLLVQNLVLAALDGVPGRDAAGAGTLLAAVRLLAGAAGAVAVTSTAGAPAGEGFARLVPVAVLALVAVLVLAAGSRPGVGAAGQRPTA